MTGPHRPRAALTPAPATAPARPADQAALPDHSAPAAPQLGPDPRRPITDVAAAPARSGPSSARAAEPQAELAARSRELAQEQRRQEALRLAQQLPDEDTDQLREQAERDASAVRTESQKRRKSAKARELAAATASTKTGPQVDAQALASEQSLMNSYMAQISAAVRKKVVMPPDVRDNPEAVYEVALIPGGEVVRARLRKSSGQPAYDIAVERAIRAAEPLPVPADPALFDQHFRTFVLRFRPVE
jgi:colicin import membrane protein